MSDQTEKPDGALPKGYDGNTPNTKAIKQKKFDFRTLFTITQTDQDQREKDLQEYEANYLARVEKEVGFKPEESSDSFRVDLEVSAEPTVDLGKLNLSRHTVNKQKKLQEERAEYEQKYLSRYKEPKGKPSKKGASKLYKLETKIKVDRKKERKEYERKFLTRYKRKNSKPGKKGASKLYKTEPKVKRDVSKERAEYEKKYLARYKEPKAKSMKSSNLKHTGDLGRLNLRKHTVAKRKEYLANRAEYEKKYLARYKEPKAKSMKSSNLKHTGDLGRLNLRKHTVAKRKEYLANRKDYEAKYIQRYMSKEKSKPKRSSGKKLDHDLISGRLNLGEYVNKKRKELHVERNVYEQKYLARYKQANAKAKKSDSTSVSEDDLGRLNLRKHTVAKRKKYLAERAEYEKKYIARYKQPKSKSRKTSNSSLYQPEKPKPKRDMKKERQEYEKQYLARYQTRQKTKRKKKK